MIAPYPDSTDSSSFWRNIINFLTGHYDNPLLGPIQNGDVGEVTRLLENVTPVRADTVVLREVPQEKRLNLCADILFDLLRQGMAPGESTSPWGDAIKKELSLADSSSFTQKDIVKALQKQMPNPEPLGEDYVLKWVEAIAYNKEQETDVLVKERLRVSNPLKKYQDSLRIITPEDKKRAWGNEDRKEEKQRLMSHDETGRTPLHHAMERLAEKKDGTSLQIVKELLNNGFDPFKPIVATAEKSFLQKVKEFFLGHVVVDDTTSPDGDTALHIAMRAGYTELALDEINKLATTKEDIVGALNRGGKGGKTLLHEAVEQRNEKLVQALLDKGASPYMPDHNGKTPLESAPETLKGALSAIPYDPEKLKVIAIAAGRRDLVGKMPTPTEQVQEGTLSPAPGAISVVVATGQRKGIQRGTALLPEAVIRAQPDKALQQNAVLKDAADKFAKAGAHNANNTSQSFVTGELKAKSQKNPRLL